MFLGSFELSFQSHLFLYCCALIQTCTVRVVHSCAHTRGVVQVYTSTMVVDLQINEQETRVTVTVVQYTHTCNKLMYMWITTRSDDVHMYR